MIIWYFSSYGLIIFHIYCWCARYFIYVNHVLSIIINHIDYREQFCWRFEIYCQLSCFLGYNFCQLFWYSQFWLILLTRIWLIKIRIPCLRDFLFFLRPQQSWPRNPISQFPPLLRSPGTPVISGFSALITTPWFNPHRSFGHPTNQPLKTSIHRHFRGVLTSPTRLGAASDKLMEKRRYSDFFP